MPRSPKGRAVARGLDAHLHLQHAFMPAGYASLKIAQVNQKCRLTVITVSTATSCGSVACMSEVIGTFLRTEFGREGTDPARETRNGSLGCFS
jgi:hypothetical protein